MPSPATTTERNQHDRIRHFPAAWQAVESNSEVTSALSLMGEQVFVKHLNLIQNWRVCFACWFLWILCHSRELCSQPIQICYDHKSVSMYGRSAAWRIFSISVSTSLQRCLFNPPYVCVRSAVLSCVLSFWNLLNYCLDQLQTPPLPMNLWSSSCFLLPHVPLLCLGYHVNVVFI